MSAQTTNRATTFGMATDALAYELGRLLGALTDEHRALQAVTAEHAGAIRRADLAAMASATGRENEIVQRIALLDRDRAALAAAGGKQLGLPAQQTPTLSWIAAHIPGPSGDALRDAARTLRDLVAVVRHERAALAQAAETLAGHMKGILRVVEQRLSGAAAYSRTGGAPAASGALCALDVTS